MAETRMTDSDVLKALNHPVRRKVMAALDEGIASPKELAGQLGLTIPNVSYHVGILRNLGLIKVVRETPRRGAVERHYKATSRALSVRQVIDWLLASDQLRPRGWEARVVELDDQGRTAIRAALEKLWKDVERIEQQSTRRLTRATGDAGERLAVGTWAAAAAR
jgi:DNA-binding transcriptional ArsR family regulator